MVIDDEPLAREGIVNYINQIDYLELVGEGSDPIELASIMDKNAIELIFLDIQMPKMNGIDFIKASSNLPMVIFTTAYPSYALEGFQLDVLDYLVKPITFNRFFKAVHKANEFHSLKTGLSEGLAKTGGDYFFIKCNRKYEKIYVNDILFVQSSQNYVNIQTTSDKFMTLMNLKNVEENLSGMSFVRAHKSYVVSINKIEAIEDNNIIIGKHRIPISRNYREQLMDLVVNEKLWKK